MVKRLHIFMNGEHVGVFSRAANGQHHLQYAQSWLDSPYARPLSLSLPLQSKVIADERVINYFDNLLPDNDEIRRRIAARFQADTLLPFDLLEKIGRDSAGAITLLPENQVLSDFKKMDMLELSSDKLESILNAYQFNLPLGMNELSEDFRISIAGAQEKTALTWRQGKWHLPQGMTPTTHIIKLPIGQIRTPQHELDLSKSVDNELICLRILSEMSLPTAQAEILSVGQTRALAVQRFDRKWIKTSNEEYLIRLPYEDGCQTFGLPAARKYESDGGVDIKKMVQERLVYSVKQNDIEQFMRTQLAFFLLAAIDGHAKNFSFEIQLGGRFCLSPIYDVISVYPLLGGRGWHEKDLRMAMSLRSSKQGKKWHWHNISAKHYLETAKYIGFSLEKMANIIEDSRHQITNAIDSVGNNLPADIDEQVRDQIFAGIRKACNKL